MSHPISDKPRRCRIIFSEESRTREPVEALVYGEGHPKGPVLSVQRLNPQLLERSPACYDVLISPNADGEPSNLGIKDTSRYNIFIKNVGELATARFSDADENDLQKVRLLSPFDPRTYAGNTFVFEDGKKFRVTEEGRCEGRQSIDGAMIDKIGGIDKGLASRMIDKFGFTRESINDTLAEFGTGIQIGSGLALSLTEYDSEKHNRPGYVVSSPVVRID